MFLKEVKLSKAKKKQAELETESWKSVSESKHEKHSLRSMFSLHTNLMRSEDPPIERGASQVNSEVFSPLSNLYSPEGNDELVAADGKRLDGWVCSEAEKYAAANEKRHHLEIDAFAEQMRLKDEKLEAFRWRMLSMEIESKRLQSHIEGLNQDVSQIRHENMKLEALLMERQKELTYLKDQFKVQIKPQFCQQANLSSSLDDTASVHDSILSKAKNAKKEPKDHNQEEKVHLTETSQEKNTEKEEEDEKAPFITSPKMSVRLSNLQKTSLRKRRLSPTKAAQVRVQWWLTL
ncbi:hypothetical protein OIU78_029293 [Salix suchowensis]|nr:hypothetical protein OIU78_029293 [Salix suchowensis]